MRNLMIITLIVLALSPLSWASREEGVVLYDRVEVTFFNDGRQI